jgi:hypothetical protein
MGADRAAFDWGERKWVWFSPDSPGQVNYAWRDVTFCDIWKRL